MLFSDCLILFGGKKWLVCGCLFIVCYVWCSLGNDFCISVVNVIMFLGCIIWYSLWSVVDKLLYYCIVRLFYVRLNVVVVNGRDLIFFVR